MLISSVPSRCRFFLWKLNERFLHNTKKNLFNEKIAFGGPILRVCSRAWFCCCFAVAVRDSLLCCILVIPLFRGAWSNFAVFSFVGFQWIWPTCRLLLLPLTECLDGRCVAPILTVSTLKWMGGLLSNSLSNFGKQTCEIFIFDDLRYCAAPQQFDPRPIDTPLQLLSQWFLLSLFHANVCFTSRAQRYRQYRQSVHSTIPFVFSVFEK